MFFLTSSDCSMTSKPATLALPAVGGRKQVRTRMVVVFPAPFLPRKPDDFALAYFEGNIFDRDITRVSLGQTFDFDHRCYV